MASVSVDQNKPVQVSQEKQEEKVVSPKLPEKVVHEKREPGKVKFYHRLKRYGVIIADHDETEFLMLRSELKFYQSYGLEEGERVEFVAGVGREGKNMAFEVTRGPMCFTCGKEGHIARYCRRATQPKRNQREGNGSGRGSSKGGCFRCGKPGHVQRDCQEEARAVAGDGGGATERACYNCGKPGHNKKDCTEPRQVASSSSAGSCYNCGQTGHLKRDCAEPPRATATSEGGGSCYSCGQTGHFKRDCPSNEQPTN